MAKSEENVQNHVKKAFFLILKQKKKQKNLSFALYIIIMLNDFQKLIFKKKTYTDLRYSIIRIFSFN